MVGLDIALSREWFVIELADAAPRDDQVSLLVRQQLAALALNVAMYWHPLDPAIGDLSHLDRPTERLRSGLTEGSELVGAETFAGPFIRHSRVGAGAAELGASDTPLLLVDYWLQFPDLRGLCLLSFSSLHVAIEPQLLLLMDNIVLTGAWVLEPDPAGTDQPG